MRRTPGDRAYEVLLESFLTSLGASSGALLAGSEINRLTLMAARNGNGRPYADSDGPDRRALRAALSAPKPIVEAGLNRNGSSPHGVLVAAPIRDLSEPLGLLWAGIQLGVKLDQDVLRWRADAYARIAALCLLGDERFAGVLGATGVDELTGCLSYAGLGSRLDSEVERATRTGSPLCCCFFDLDGFKLVNDRHGHMAGNVVLAGVGATLLGNLRAYDAVSRFGGDEFVLVLPDTRLAEARSIGERLGRLAIAEVGAGVSSALSISVGSAEWQRGSSAADLLEGADSELKLAKAANGQNQ